MPAQDGALRWELARDERFRRIARSGETVAAAAHRACARIEVRGLDPARDCFTPRHRRREAAPRAARAIAARAASRTARVPPGAGQLPAPGTRALGRTGDIARAAPDLLVHGGLHHEGATTANRVRAHVGGTAPRSRTIAGATRKHMDPALQARMRPRRG
ncbi:MAG: hypothetical protein IPH71_05840 [Proteobacteria bacterium]|nr:hypothetical protein [Pseudomonadota bacterium]